MPRQSPPERSAGTPTKNGVRRAQRERWNTSSAASALGCRGDRFLPPGQTPSSTEKSIIAPTPTTIGERSQHQDPLSQRRRAGCPTAEQKHPAQYHGTTTTNSSPASSRVDRAGASALLDRPVSDHRLPNTLHKIPEPSGYSREFAGRSCAAQGGDLSRMAWRPSTRARRPAVI